MTELLTSFVTSANTAGNNFPLNNLPYGVFAEDNNQKHCGVAIGDYVLNAALLEQQGIVDLGKPLLQSDTWNPLMEAGPEIWKQLRQRLTDLLKEDSEYQEQLNKALIPLTSVTLHMPFTVAEFTDFYACRHHATNVGTMFRGAENALPPNWLHIPIGYNGRASSVVVSGTDIRRPWGQLKGPNDEVPTYAPSARFDIELEMGAIVGQASSGPVTVSEAEDMIFGYVLLNDWSARDIQAWEYQPLGPFQAKATATTISPWIITKAALEPFRCNTPTREKELLPHLQDAGPQLYNINLSVTLQPEGKAATTICTTNFNEMYYSSAQQLAHHTTSGCPMRVGDLLGSGTVSGPEKHNRGALLELSWGGKEPITLDCGEVRSFIEDHDTLTLTGAAKGNGYQIGFGDCVGTLLPAINT